MSGAIKSLIQGCSGARMGKDSAKRSSQRKGPGNDSTENRTTVLHFRTVAAPPFSPSPTTHPPYHPVFRASNLSFSFSRSPRPLCPGACCNSRKEDDGHGQVVQGSAWMPPPTPPTSGAQGAGGGGTGVGVICVRVPLGAAGNGKGADRLLLSVKNRAGLLSARPVGGGDEVRSTFSHPFFIHQPASAKPVGTHQSILCRRSLWERQIPCNLPRTL